MPGTMKEPIRGLVHSDFLYSNIMVLSPPGLRGPLPEYGKALIFDCAVKYAEIVSRVDDNSAEFAYWTFYDFRCAAYASSRFLDVLQGEPHPLSRCDTPQILQEAKPISASPNLRSGGPEQMVKEPQVVWIL